MHADRILVEEREILSNKDSLCNNIRVVYILLRRYAQKRLIADR